MLLVDGTQLYTSTFSRMPHTALQTLKTFILESWMFENKLKLNDKKTEALMIHKNSAMLPDFMSRSRVGFFSQEPWVCFFYCFQLLCSFCCLCCLFCKWISTLDFIKWQSTFFIIIVYLESYRCTKSIYEVLYWLNNKKKFHSLSDFVEVETPTLFRRTPGVCWCTKYFVK